MPSPTPSRPGSLADEERTLQGQQDPDQDPTPPADRCPDASPDQPKPRPAPTTPRHKSIQMAATCSLLVFACLWGTLARLGLQWLGGFAERATFASIWPQLVGCVLMGLVQERRNTVEAVWPPVWTMVAVGFCGTVTNFALFMENVFGAFANLDSPGYGRFSGFLTGTAILLITFCAASSAISLGVHLHAALPSLFRTLRPRRRPASALPHPALTTLALLLGPLFYLGAILLFALGPASWRPRATFALLFAPFGTLLRFGLSQRLNPINPRFPWGTFACNALSMAVFAVAAVLQRGGGLEGTRCAALTGVQNGFCGALSTISTMVVELQGMEARAGWRYWLASVGMGQAVLVVILGSWVWSGDRGGTCSA